MCASEPTLKIRKENGDGVYHALLSKGFYLFQQVFIAFIYVCVCVYTHMVYHDTLVQKRTFRSGFSPSTTWRARIDLRSFRLGSE